MPNEVISIDSCKVNVLVSFSKLSGSISFPPDSNFPSLFLQTKETKNRNSRGGKASTDVFSEILGSTTLLVLFFSIEGFLLKFTEVVLHRFLRLN